MMTLAEFGLYNWLLDHAWANESKPCFLENDQVKLSRLIGQPLRIYLKAWDGIQKKFKLWIDPRTEVEYFYSEWLYEEFNKRLAFSEQQSVKGKIRAAERWKNHSRGYNPATIRLQSGYTSGYNPATNDEDKEKVSPTPPSKRNQENPIVPSAAASGARVPGEVEEFPEYPPDFEEFFWLPYPRKRGKGAALKAWNKIKPSNGLRERIRSKIEEGKHSPDWIRDDGRWIPNPATFLNQGRWDDVFQATQNRPDVTF